MLRLIVVSALVIAIIPQVVIAQSCVMKDMGICCFSKEAYNAISSQQYDYKKANEKAKKEGVTLDPKYWERFMSLVNDFIDSGEAIILRKNQRVVIVDSGGLFGDMKIRVPGYRESGWAFFDRDKLNCD